MVGLQVISEMRFFATPDGKVWSGSTNAYDMWRRYLTAFEEVSVIARVNPVSHLRDAFHRADGPGVKFVRLPGYTGAGQFVLRFHNIYSILRKRPPDHFALIYRIPSILAEIAHKSVKQRPYAVEVVGDPLDVFAPRAVRHPLRPILRSYFARHVRILCAKASAVAYVSKSLAKRYPPNSTACVANYSSIELPEDAFFHTKRTMQRNTKKTLVFVGSLAQAYKGADLLIDALKACSMDGYAMDLRVIGGGRYSERLMRQAKKLGLADRITFVGELPVGAAIRRELDGGDIFVLPTRTEGLPRAIIEAMARAKPCISTTVGGIPELLPPEDLVPPNDAKALALKIMEVIDDPERMQTMAERNYRKARDYHKDILDRRRAVFYSQLRYNTEAWLKDEKCRLKRFT